jgi:hypothetical protein
MRTDERGCVARFVYEAFPVWVSERMAALGAGRQRRRQQRASWKQWQAGEARRRRVIEAIKGPEGRWVDQVVRGL